MYLAHFGLREWPFSLTPDTAFFLSCPSHREALNMLLFALRSGEGFTKVSGEVGTGKTILCRKLLAELGERFVSAWVPNPPSQPDALLAALALELDLVPDADFHTTMRAITRLLIELDAAGKPVVLILDEAQALPEPCLEAVRLLTNLETEKRKLLQVVLFGQPELDAKLARPTLRQLRQRISFSHRLRPLSLDELRVYVEHRLRVAGASGMPLFQPTALGLLHRASGGVPRLANVLAHKSLLVAYGRGERQVARAHVRRAALDTEDARPLRRSVPSALWNRA